MKKLLIILISVPAFAVSIFAQSAAKSECPGLRVIGPSAVTRAGNPGTFTLDVDTKEKDLKLEYLWSISSGEIISGQNTPAITVRFENMGVTATVEIKGLPEGCPNSASEWSGCDYIPDHAKRLERFEGPITAADKPRFKKIFEALRNDSGARVLIFVGYRTERELKEKKRAVVKYLRRTAPERVTLIAIEAREDLTEAWLVPLGAREPRVEEGIVVP